MADLLPGFWNKEDLTLRVHFPQIFSASWRQIYALCAEKSYSQREMYIGHAQKLQLLRDFVPSRPPYQASVLDTAGGLPSPRLPAFFLSPNYGDRSTPTHLTLSYHIISRQLSDDNIGADHRKISLWGFLLLGPSQTV